MKLIQVAGAVGGIGTSAFAWCVARALGAAYACDYAAHAGGLRLAAGLASTNCDWPTWPMNASPAAFEELSEQLLGHAVRAGQVQVLSGEVSPPDSVRGLLIQHALSRQPVVTDGWVVDDELTNVDHKRILIVPNSLAGVRAATKRHPAVHVVLALSRRGLPRTEVMSQLGLTDVLSFRYQSAVRRAMALGIEVPEKSSLNRAAEICAQ